MLKQLKYIAIPSLMLASMSVYAENLFQCPLFIKCSNQVCKKPMGYENWRLNQPIKTFSTSFIKPTPTKKLTAYFFYGSLYTKFGDEITATCLYRDRNGPYLYLEKAGNFKPIMYRYHKYQWLDLKHGRFSCIAAHPDNCSFESE